MTDLRPHLPELAAIARAETSRLRLATLAMAAAVLIGGGIVYDGDPFAALGILWYPGAAWLILAGLAPPPGGESPPLMRALAGGTFPALIALCGAVGQILNAESTPILAASALWTAAIMTALARWRQYREPAAPARILATAALTLLAAVHILLAWAGVIAEENADLVTTLAIAAGVLLAAALIAPRGHARNLPLATLVLATGFGLTGLVRADPVWGWIAASAVAWLTPFFARRPESVDPRLIWRSPTGAALGAALLFAAIFGIAETTWLAVYASLWLVRDLILWRVLTDLAPGDRAPAVIWLAWGIIVHSASVTLLEAGAPPFLAGLIGGALETEDIISLIDQGVWPQVPADLILPALCGTLIAGCAAVLISRRRSGSGGEAA